jgi:fucose permease
MIWFMPHLIKRFGFKRNMVIGLASLAIAMVIFSGLPSFSDNTKNQIFANYVLPVDSYT